MKAKTLFGVMLIGLSVTSANAGSVNVDGTDWRQITDTIGLDYADMETIYDVSTGQLLNPANSTVVNGYGQTVDFAGWVWATEAEVATLFSYYLGAAIGPDQAFYEQASTWAGAFNNDFITNFTLHYSTSPIGYHSNGISRDRNASNRVQYQIVQDYGYTQYDFMYLTITEGNTAAMVGPRGVWVHDGTAASSGSSPLTGGSAPVPTTLWLVSGFVLALLHTNKR